MLTTFYITFQLIYYIVIRVSRLGVKHYHLKLSLIQLNPLIKLRDLSCRRYSITAVLKLIYSYPFPFFFTHIRKHPLIRTLRILAAKQNHAGSYMWVTVKLRWTFQVNQGVWGLVHTYPFLLENGYFFPRFGLPSLPTYQVKTVTENASFQKRSSEWRFLKTPA